MDAEKYSSTFFQNRDCEQGVKSCKDCVYPHDKENYQKITGRFHEIKAVIRRMDGEEK